MGSGRPTELIHLRTDSSELEDRGDKEASKEATNEDAEPKKKRFSLFKRKKKS